MVKPPHGKIDPLSRPPPRLCRPPHTTALPRPVPQPTTLQPPKSANGAGPSDAAIGLGDQFATFIEFKAAMAEWSAREHFDIRYKKSDNSVNLVVCWVEECTFRIRAQKKAKVGCIEVTVLNNTHTACVGLLPSKRRSVSTQTFLQATVPKIMQIDRVTKPKEIVKAINHEYNQSISYHVAHRVLGPINGTSIDEREQFRQLGLLVEIICQADPVGYVKVDIDPDTSRFRNFFICPSAARLSFENGCLPMMVCDGTFTKAKFRQILLFAVTLDANNHILLLPWGLVPSENEATWKMGGIVLNTKKGGVLG